MDTSSLQKINKEILILSDTLDQAKLIDIYKTFHPNTAGYTFLSSAHGTFFMTDLMLDYKTSLNKFKHINSVRLVINYKGKKTAKKKKKTCAG